jgi:hypothetical protein
MSPADFSAVVDVNLAAAYRFGARRSATASTFPVGPIGFCYIDRGVYRPSPGIQAGVVLGLIHLQQRPLVACELSQSFIVREIILRNFSQEKQECNLFRRIEAVHGFRCNQVRSRIHLL